MITITYKCDSEFPGVTTDCRLELTDDTNCPDAFEAFARVLQVAGYQNESIRHSAEGLEYNMRERIEAAASIMTTRVGDS